MVNSTSEVCNVRPNGSRRAASTMTTPSTGIGAVVGTAKVILPGVSGRARADMRCAWAKAEPWASARLPWTLRSASVEMPKSVMSAPIAGPLKLTSTTTALVAPGLARTAMAWAPNEGVGAPASKVAAKAAPRAPLASTGTALTWRMPSLGNGWENPNSAWNGTAPAWSRPMMALERLQKAPAVAELPVTLTITCEAEPSSSKPSSAEPPPTWSGVTG